jgi:hypothetical protein
VIYLKFGQQFVYVMGIETIIEAFTEIDKSFRPRLQQQFNTMGY